MSLESDIFSALTGLAGGRVYPVILPQSASVPITPAIAYQFISSELDQDICGDGGDATANTRTQVDAYSTSHPTCRALRLQVIAAMGGLTKPTVWVGGFDDYDPVTKLYRCSLDFITYPSSA